MAAHFKEPRFSRIQTNLGVGVADPESNSGSRGDDLIGDVAVGPNAVADHGHGTNHLKIGTWTLEVDAELVAV